MPFVQDADARLTLTRVAPAPALVAEIAQATGQRLEASPALRTEILMVSVENAQVSEVLKRIAVAATANWIPAEGGYRLVPDSAARSVEATAGRARRAQAILDGLKKRADAAKGKPDAQGEASAFSTSATVDAFIPMIDVNALAAMEPGDRIVFATNPTPTQRPLRGNPGPIVAGWVESHNKQAHAMAAQMDNVPEGLSALMTGPTGRMFKRMTTPVTGKPAKVVLVATRGGVPFLGGAGLDIRLEARAYGADGSVLVEQTGTLDADLMGRLMALGKPNTSATGKTTPIAYSPEARALIASSAMPTVGMGVNVFNPRSSLSPALKTYLLGADKRDPLTLVPGEGLAALAKARRKPLVALLPDAAYPAMLSNEAPATVEAVEEGFRAGPMRLVPDSTFLVVKPADPDDARRNRLDRTALATFLRAIGDHETPTLGEFAAFAARTPDPTQNRLSQAMLQTFYPSSLGSMKGVVSWPALRLYAALSPAQLTSLEAGAPVPFTNLAPAAKDALRTMLYGAGGGLTVDRNGVATEPDPISIGLKMAMGGGAVDAREEPTEAAPGGLPANGYLQAVVSTEPILRPVTPEGPSNSLIDVDQLAMTKLVASSSMADRVGDAMRLPETARLGSRKEWRLQGFIGPNTYVAASLSDDRVPKDAPQVSLSSLPTDLQTRVAAKADKLKKSPLGAIMSMGAMMGGGTQQRP